MPCCWRAWCVSLVGVLVYWTATAARIHRWLTWADGRHQLAVGAADVLVLVQPQRLLVERPSLEVLLALVQLARPGGELGGASAVFLAGHFQFLSISSRCS